MRFLKRLILLLALAGLGFIGLVVAFASRPLPLKSTPLEFEIPPGLSLSAASRRMSDAGLGFAPWQFSLLGRVLGRAADIKAGSYLVEQGLTPMGLLDKLTRGDVTQGELLLVEGRSFRQLRAALDASHDLRHDTAGLSDAELLAKLQINAPHPEGLFFPDTYLFPKQSSDLDVLKRAAKAMDRHLTEEWNSRADGLPYRTPYEALIMASIVEKETGRPSDRPQIAAVFINRLRTGMLLQTDPTVIYGLGERFDGNLRRVDLQTDTPWNTYTRVGLPPTPIAMPGLAALRAALHPPVSDKFYFVARGDGTSEFSHSLDEHNRAVYRYQKHKGGNP
ncbi:MAG TPA: endolytic transglycosylase MltG [Rhodocyclaceae bacterium]|nr:endolytic transglycosylase MltG [Rhodocyclaceae bacterium]